MARHNHKKLAQFGEDFKNVNLPAVVGSAIPGPVGSIISGAGALSTAVKGEDESGVAASPERAAASAFLDPGSALIAALSSGDEKTILTALTGAIPGSVAEMQKGQVAKREREISTEELEAEQATKFSGEDVFTNPNPIQFREGADLSSTIPNPIPVLKPNISTEPIPQIPIRAVPDKFFGIKVLHRGKEIPASQFQKIKKLTDEEMLQNIQGFGDALKKSKAFVAERNFRHGVGSFIKPSRKGLFTAKANTAGKSVQEHAEFVMNNKDQFDSETVRQANFAKNAGRGFKKAQEGLDTGMPNGLNASPSDIERATAIASGAIEVEKNELVLNRTDGGRYKEVADFKDAPTHADGGRTFVPKEGDIIFPSYKRKKIKEFLKNKDFQSIDAERITLPKSGSTKARHGMINASSPFATHNFKAQTGLDNEFFDESIPSPMPTLTPTLPIEPVLQEPLAGSPEVSGLTTDTSGFTTDVTGDIDEIGKIGDADTTRTSRIGTLASLAPAISNIFEGLTSTAKVTKPVFNPKSEEAIRTLENITFDIDPGLQDIARSEQAAFDKTRNLAAGNTAVLLGNVGNIRSQTLREKNKLRTQKSNIENLAKRQLAETLQQLGSEEARSILFAEQATEAAEAKKREFIRTGISQASEAIQRQQLQKNRQLSDAEKLEIIKAAYPDLANVLG